MRAAGPREGPRAGARAQADARVGPNAIVQLGEALRARLGEERAAEVYAAAGLSPLLSDPPQAMVDERLVAALFRALYDQLPGEEPGALAAEAGARTASYLLANRIPAPARVALGLLPRGLSARLLLRAIAGNAWTFAGSGGFRARAGRPHRIEIAANPIPLPGCVWHVAVFEGLFRALVAPEARVRHVACCLAGAPACRFEIGFERAPEGAPRPHRGPATPERGRGWRRGWDSNPRMGKPIT